MATSYPPLANGSYRVGDPAQPFPSRTPGPPPQGSLPPGGVYWHGMPRPAQQPQPLAPQALAPQAHFAPPQPGPPPAPFAQAPQPGAPHRQLAPPQAPFVPASQPVTPFVPSAGPQAMTAGPVANPGVGAAAAYGTVQYVDLPRPVAPAARQWIRAGLGALAVVIISVVVLGVPAASAQPSGGAVPAGGVLAER